MEAYDFPNIEMELVSMIRSVVRVESGVDIPAPRPDEYVQVVRVGGTSGLVTDSPMVTFYAWSPSWKSAVELGGLVRRRVGGVTRFGAVPVYRVREIGGLARAPDPADGSPRYQFTVEFKLRGSTAPSE